MNRKKTYFHAAAVPMMLWLVLMQYCAKQGMPPGGPEDKTAPRIVTTIPDSNAVDVPRENRTVEFEFDELVQPSAIEAVFITPYVEDAEIRLKGRRLSVRLPDSLKQNTTYVITLGTGIRDYRNNTLESSYTLAFSTGDSLDQGRFSGRILDEEDAAGIDVWAFRLNGSSPCHPEKTPPEYIVQCTKEGKFRFSYMADGRYRVMAVQDRQLNRLYDAGMDRIGLASRDIVIDSDDQRPEPDVLLKMTQEDTLPPRLIGVRPVDRHRLIARFDKAVEAVDSTCIILADSSGVVMADSLYSWFIDTDQTSQIHVLSSEFEENRIYGLEACHLKGINGYAVPDSLNSGTWTGIAHADTTKPVLMRIQPKPGRRDMHPDSSIVLTFDEPMDTVNFITSIAIEDTSGTALECYHQWAGLNKLEIVPDKQWPGSQICRVSLPDSMLKDWAGNWLADSTFQFTLINPDTLSDILGHIQRREAWGNRPVVLEARQIESNKNKYILNISKNDSTFIFKRIMPGNYVIMGYVDTDENGCYSFGRLFPYCPAEPVSIIKDTLRARTRWPNEGNRIQF